MTVNDQAFMDLITTPGVRQAVREAEALVERMAALTPQERMAALVLADVVVNEDLEQAVAEARAGGFAWQDVADATHRTRQSAHQRWRHVDARRGE